MFLKYVLRSRSRLKTGRLRNPDCIHQILDNMKTCSIPIVRNLFRIQNAFPMAQLVIPTYEGHGVESQLPRLQPIGGGTGGG